MNFATTTLQLSGFSDAELCRTTEIPRDYLRKLRIGAQMRKGNINGVRTPATDDERWKKLASVLLPSSKENQEKFLLAVVTLQQGPQSGDEISLEVIEDPNFIYIQSTSDGRETIAIPLTFTGTLIVTNKEGKTYTITKS